MYSVQSVSPLVVLFPTVLHFISLHFVSHHIVSFLVIALFDFALLCFECCFSVFFHHSVFGKCVCVCVNACMCEHWTLHACINTSVYVPSVTFSNHIGSRILFFSCCIVYHSVSFHFYVFSLRRMDFYFISFASICYFSFSLALDVSLGSSFRFSIKNFILFGMIVSAFTLSLIQYFRIVCPFAKKKYQYQISAIDILWMGSTSSSNLHCHSRACLLAWLTVCVCVFFFIATIKSHELRWYNWKHIKT